MNAIGRRYSFVLKGILFGVLILPVAASAQGQKPLTLADLSQLKSAGFDDQTIINAISTNGVSLDTSVTGLLALKKAGLSEKVINAAITSSSAKAPAAVASESTGLPDEIGAYAIVKDSLTALPVEVVNFKTAGTLGMAFTYGLKKAKFKGIVPGSKSSAQLTSPVTLVLRCADGTSPVEYQLIPLEVGSDAREFTQSKMGLTGASTGVDKEAIALKFEKVARNTYRVTVSDLKKGEYGFLAPGALASANGASTGKLYTFGVGE